LNNNSLQGSGIVDHHIIFVVFSLVFSSLVVFSSAFYSSAAFSSVAFPVVVFSEDDQPFY
jgi:hypothetical protein